MTVVGVASGCECGKEQGSTQSAPRPSGLQHGFVGQRGSTYGSVIKVLVKVVQGCMSARYTAARQTACEVTWNPNGFRDLP